ncbi:hypothetical protein CHINAEXTREME_05910 [Halobiforma lacisalsi AJ5]|uniref:Coiled-coil protein n=1 Tax=Natronobacterium lacisalsi AJ5 TaxID=358396 RepID=M0LJY9_NATLA|nr:hypothetical protein [Halobiforma lacisalsi]APW97335.1 hypothetical protein CHINAEXTREME_05910 [Halobiforma lacisalsi AJ5]EMA33851.1 coiled-coil protein [Halobiforma lacisalsi AJ5]
MQIDRSGGGRWPFGDPPAVATNRGSGTSFPEVIDPAVTSLSRGVAALEPTVGVAGDLGTGVGLALVVGGVLVLGGGLAAAVRARSGSTATAANEGRSEREASTDSRVDGGSGTDDRPSSTLGGDEDPRVAFEERIGDGTLERLEPIAPAAVDRARAFDPDSATDPKREIDRLERELRTALEEAIADGRLDPGVSSAFGEPYEIVNLPSQYREVTLPPSDGTIHVADVESVAADVLEEERHVRDAARTIGALYDHCREIETYVRRQEEAFTDRREAVEETLADVRELADRLEDDLGDRIGEFVVEGRHESIDGVVEIERLLSDATRALHRCTFDEAMRTLDQARASSDELLVTVDFLGGVVGTVDHGRGRIDVPEEVPLALVADVVPLVTRRHDVAVDLDREAREIVLEKVQKESRGDRDRQGETGRKGIDPGSGPGSDPGSDPPPASSSDPKPGDSRGTDRERAREAVTPESIADEILYVLRELDGVGDAASVECQTERLPDPVAEPAVLEELARFCRRQTDVVVDVELQEGAPPGFLEIRFDEHTGVDAGLETLRERFADRYGG